jgi:UDP-N-acetylmuramoyl-tripeptide--D-alanyl-D-alanine ligase
MLISSLSEIADILGVDRQGSAIMVDALSLDSRRIAAENQERGTSCSLYIALKGPHYDGHDYIHAAIDAGAVAVIGTKECSGLSVPYLRVNDSYKALSLLGKAQRCAFHYPVVGVTGSVGKTTVKEMIHSILSQQALTLMTPGSMNNDIGVPLALCRLTTEHRAAVIEMGARRKGDIAYLGDIVQPTVAVLTCIAPAHIGVFGSLSAIVEAKTEIIDHLDPEGIFVFNAHEPKEYQRLWKDTVQGRQCLSFGVDVSADFTATHFTSTFEKNSFLLETPQGCARVSLSLMGKHQVCNAVAAAAAAAAVGSSLADIVGGLEAMRPLPQRGVIKRLNAWLTVVDDVYNANSSSMQAAIRTLATFPGRRVMVIGDMAELGEEATLLHQHIGTYAQEQGIEACFSTGDYAGLVLEAFGNREGLAENHTILMDKLLSYLRSDQKATCVWIKGSRSAGMEVIVSALETALKDSTCLFS